MAKQVGSPAKDKKDTVGQQQVSKKPGPEDHNTKDIAAEDKVAAAKARAAAIKQRGSSASDNKKEGHRDTGEQSSGNLFFVLLALSMAGVCVYVASDSTNVCITICPSRTVVCRQI